MATTKSFPPRRFMGTVFSRQPCKTASATSPISFRSSGGTTPNKSPATRIPMASLWAKWIFIYSARDNIGSFTRNLAPISGASGKTVAFTSRSGRRTPNASVWSEISMAGMGASTPCAGCSGAVSGNYSFRRSAKTFITNSKFGRTAVRSF